MKRVCSYSTEVYYNNKVEKYNVVSFIPDGTVDNLILSCINVKNIPGISVDRLTDVILEIERKYPYIDCISSHSIKERNYRAYNSPHKYIVIYISYDGDIECDIFGYKNGFNPGKNYQVVVDLECKTVDKFLENPLIRVSHIDKEIHRYDTMLNAGCREKYINSVKGKVKITDLINEYGNDQNQLQRKKSNGHGTNVPTGSGIKVERSKLTTKVGQIGNREIVSYFKATIRRSPYNISIGHQEDIGVEG